MGSPFPKGTTREVRCLSWAPGCLPGPLPGTVASLLGATLRLPVLTASQSQGLGLPDPGALGGWGPSYLSHAGPQPGEGGHRAPRAPWEQLLREAVAVMVVGRPWFTPTTPPPPPGPLLVGTASLGTSLPAPRSPCSALVPR